MAYSVEDFKKDINEILEICQEDLRAIAAGEKRQATKKQIEGTIIPEMNELLDMIKRNKLPEKRATLYCFGGIYYERMELGYSKR